MKCLRGNQIPFGERGVYDAQSKPPYTSEFRRRMVGLRAGRQPEELATKWEPSAQSIRNWVVQADRADGRRSDGLSSTERDELRRLQRENKTLREERDILKKVRGLVARETNSMSPKDSSS